MENDDYFAGRDYAAEGRRFARHLYPRAKDRKGQARRLLRRAHPLIRSQDQRLQRIGFFIYGISEGCREVRP